MFRRGFRRFTTVVDVLLRRGDFDRVFNQLIELGYWQRNERSRILFDPTYGVQTRFFRDGDPPGGRHSPLVAYPDPVDCFIERNGLRFATLESIVTLKLASGLQTIVMLRDVADAQELIHRLHLPLEFAERIDPTVREAYRELWRDSQGPDFHRDG